MKLRNEPILKKRNKLMITIKKVIYSSCSKSENEPNRQFVEKSLNSPFCQKLTTWDILKNFRPAARADWAWLFLTWLLTTGPLLAGNFYTNYTSATVPWTDGIVPYEFTNTLTAAQQQTYLDGLREWELAANVKFVPHTNQSRWILFTYNTNYLDNVSPGYNPADGHRSPASAASQVGHEMGHSFGFTHENIRPDQTNHLTVISNNITPGNLQFFQIDPNSVTNGPLRFRIRHASGLGFCLDPAGRAAHATTEAALFSPLPVSHGQFLFQSRRPRGLALSLRPARGAADQHRHHHR